MKKVTRSLQPFLEAANDVLAQRKADGVGYRPELVRDGLEQLGQFCLQKKTVAEITDKKLVLSDREIPVRIYNSNPCEKKPVLIYFHGGGHMCGSIEVFDNVARRLAVTSNHIVVSVEYRLAPEFPYPCGLEDGYEVVSNISKFLSEDLINNNVLSLAGDSAGGALAATIAYRCHLEGKVEIEKLVLIYPSLDYTFSTDSYDKFKEGYLLEKEKIEWYFSHYFLSITDRKLASPLFFSKLEILPEVLIIGAGLDPLVDEGKLFYERLKEENVSATYHMEPDLIHGFLNLESFIPERIERVYQRIGSFFI